MKLFSGKPPARAQGRDSESPPKKANWKHPGCSGLSLTLANSALDTRRKSYSSYASASDRDSTVETASNTSIPARVREGDDSASDTSSTTKFDDPQVDDSDSDYKSTSCQCSDQDDGSANAEKSSLLGFAKHQLGLHKSLCQIYAPLTLAAGLIVFLFYAVDSSPLAPWWKIVLFNQAMVSAFFLLFGMVMYTTSRRTLYFFQVLASLLLCFAMWATSFPLLTLLFSDVFAELDGSAFFVLQSLYGNSFFGISIAGLLFCVHLASRRNRARKLEDSTGSTISTTGSDEAPIIKYTLGPRAAILLGILVASTVFANCTLINLYMLITRVWSPSEVAKVLSTGVAYPILASLIGRFLVGDFLAFLMVTFVTGQEGSHMGVRRFWITVTRMTLSFPCIMSVYQLNTFQSFLASAMLSNICELASVYANVYGPNTLFVLLKRLHYNAKVRPVNGNVEKAEFDQCEQAAPDDNISAADVVRAWTNSLNSSRDKEKSKVRLLIFMHGEEITEKLTVFSVSIVYVFHYLVLNYSSFGEQSIDDFTGTISSLQVLARIAILFLLEAIEDALKMKIFTRLTGGLSTTKIPAEPARWRLPAISGFVISCISIHVAELAF